MKSMGARTIALLTFALAPSLAAAQGRADICYSTWSGGNIVPTNNMLFNCPTAGNRTLPQLAGDGWIIGRMTPIARTNSSGYEYATQLVIRQEWIFRNGFEGP